MVCHCRAATKLEENCTAGLGTQHTRKTTHRSSINALTPETCGSNFKWTVFKPNTQNSRLGTQCEITFGGMSHNLANRKLTLVQVMAWCRQATSHYLSQCWPRSMSPMASLGLNELSYWLRDKWQWFFKPNTQTIFKPNTQNYSLGNCCKITPRWMPQNLTNEKSMLVQIMAWCHQAISHHSVGN